MGFVRPKLEHCDVLADVLNINKKVLIGTEKPNLSRYIDILFYRNANVPIGSTGYISENEPESILVPSEVILKSVNKNKNIACIRFYGDSMIPVLNNKALLVMDLTDTSVVDGGMYVISHDKVLRVRILYNLVNGIRIYSYNRYYDDEIYDHKDLELGKFKIVGRVIWYSIISKCL